MKYQAAVSAVLVTALLLTGCGASSAKTAASASASDVSSAVSTPAADLSSAASTQPDTSQADSSEVQTEEPPADPEPPTQDHQQLLEAVEQADWSWFDDAVMVGDSVSLKLKNFVVQQRQSDSSFFGQGQFLTSGSLGSGNALWPVSDKSVHPTFQGEKMLLEQSIPLTGAKKVYIMLGVNDIAVYGIEGAVANYGQLLDQISQADPQVEFYIQSATPICQGAEVGSLTNANLELYNQALEEMCRQRGIHFIDVAAVLRDEEGYLPREYCSDPDGMGIHLMDEACKLWLGYLLEDARFLQAAKT